MSTLTPQDRSKLNLQRSVDVLAGASIMLEGGTSISYAKFLEILTAAIGSGGGGGDNDTRQDYTKEFLLST